jgi:mono/diheme cytochrome c family protein
VSRLQKCPAVQATRMGLVAWGLLLVFACRGEGQAPGRYGLGRTATRAEIVAWDLDVNSAGEGLPQGSGTATRGAAIFAAKCAACHGQAGEGSETAPALVGREPREGFPFGKSLKYPRTVGNYWPYATTLFDYLRRAMPVTAPGSLQSNEIYDLVAWILVRNEIIPPDAVMSATTLPRVRMPARDKFVPDDRRGGKEFRSSEP